MGKIFRRKGEVFRAAPKGYGGGTWKRFCKNRVAFVSLIVVAVIVVAVAGADFIMPYDAVIRQKLSDRFQFPSFRHFFGTDELGRDLFARILHGGRISLSVGVASTVIALAIGAFLAAMCGYFGGWFDSITMRICDVFTCIPSFLFALTVIAALGPSLLNLMFAITVSSVPYYIRMMRSVILSIAEEGYIEAAHACDTRGLSMIVRHILPNAIGPIIVTASMSVADMLLAMAGLSFIGLGVQPPAPEWGAMLSTAREHMRAYPYLLIFPGSLIAITALCFNLIGDGLRDAMDPRGME